MNSYCVNRFRTTLQKDFQVDLDKINEYVVEEGDVYQLMNGDGRQAALKVIEISDLTEQQAKDYIEHVSKGESDICL